MAKKAYVGVGDKARKITNAYIPENEYLGRKIKKIYVGVDGKARLAYQMDTTATSASVSLRTSPLTTTLTIKDLCYGGGYWVAVANDSSNDLYLVYCTNTIGEWTCRKLATGRAYPATGIAYVDTYDGYVVSCTASGSYSNRNLILIPKTMMTGSSTSYTYFADGASYSWSCIASANGYFFTGGKTISTNYPACRVNLTAGTPGSNTKTYTFAGTLGSGEIFDVCAHKNAFFVLATNNVGVLMQGDYTYIGTFNEDGTTNNIFDNATSHCIASMGDYLVVACTKSDGTYIYYTKGSGTSATVWSKVIWGYQKITSTMVTPKALAYANGKCVLAYENGGNIYFATA